jgi:hypothetical protein
MYTLKKSKDDTKSSAYASLACPVVEDGAACWDPYREEQIHVLDRVQHKAANLHITGMI